MGGFAWVTLATNDSYSLGALVLAHSLRRAGTPHDLVVLITPGVTDAMREKLSAVFSLVQEVNILDSKDESNLRLLARPELGITFTKLHCWRLIQYDKCVFVDADALVVRNCDELFEREEFSAAPDVGWPDCFNSGVFVFKPSQETYNSLVEFATEKGSFDGGDQGLLNMYFSDWSRKDISKHLPFIYNMCSTASYSYLPAFRQFGDDVRIIHFIGVTKPWLQYFDTVTGIVQPPAGSSHLQPLLQTWWNIFCDKVHPQLNPDMATSTLAPPWHNISSYPPISSGSYQVFQNPNHDTYSDVVLDKPDFSEFKDPWNDYSPELDPFLRGVQATEGESERERSYLQEPDEVYSNHQQSPESQNSLAQFQTIRNEETNETKSYHYQESENFEKQPWQDLSQRLEAHQLELEKKEGCQSVSYEHQNQEDTYSHQEFQPYQQEQNCIHQEFQSHQPEYYSNHQEFQLQPEHYSNQQEFQSHQQEYHSSHEFQSYQQENHFSPEEYHLHTQDQDFNQEEFQSKQEPQSRQQEFQLQEKEVLSQNFINNQANFQEPLKHSCKGTLKTSVVNDRQQDREVDSNEDRSNDKLTTTYILNSRHPLKIRVIPKNVTPQSEQKKKHLESEDAGLPGALAKLTLGEARSNEQIAYEEHMRRQSWEQGQIDYLGRDSFDNIWKKISETLAAAPEREKTPPQTIEPELKKEITEALMKAEAEKTESKKPEEVTPGTDEGTEQQKHFVESPPITTKSQDTVPVVVPEKEIKPVVEEQKEVAAESEGLNLVLGDIQRSITDLEKVQQLPEPTKETSIVPESVPAVPVSKIPVIPAEIQSPPVSEPITETPLVPKDIQSIGIPQTPVASEQIQSAPLPETPISEVSQPTPVTTESIPAPQVKAEEVQEKPVPIQVAESVLQAEPKESVSQVTSPVGEEAISSIVSTVEESALAVSEALMNPPTSESAAPKIENGNVDPQNVSLSSPTISSSQPTSESCTALLTRSPNIVSIIPEPQVSSVPEVKPKEEIKEAREAEVKQKPVVSKTAEEAKETEKSTGAKEVQKAEESKEPLETKSVKLERRKSSSMEKPLLPAGESKLTVHIPQSQPCEISGSVEQSREEKKKSNSPSEASTDKSQKSEALESLACPVRSKEMKVPSTPTVTEATPPTSPPIDPEKEAESESKTGKKGVKKVVKKQSTEESEDAEGEVSGKKGPKKVVKKVLKKKDGPEAEGSSSTEKAKKATKKTSSKAQLETDKSVPETPPPGSSEAPVPPKRKTKSTTTAKETTSKKPDTEL